MANINPRARGGDSLSGALVARRKREEQLGRQRMVLPTSKPAVAPTAGGGILGIAEVDSVSSSILHSPSGLDTSSVQYGSPYDFGIAGLMSAGSFCTVVGGDLHLAPGQYELACRLSYGWASGVAAPSAVQVAMVNENAASDAFHSGYDQMFPTYTQGDGASGVCVIVGGLGRTIVGDGGAAFRLQVYASGQPAAAGTPVAGIAGDPGMHWTVWKYA